MRNPPSTLLWLLVLIAPAVGQVDPYFWSVGPTQGPFPTFVEPLDRNGVAVMSWPLVTLGNPSASASPIVVKMPSGTTWIGDRLSGSLTPYTAMGGPGVPVSAPNLTAMATSSLGGPVTLEGNSVVLRDAVGAPLSVIATSMALPDRIATGPAGIWVLDSSVVPSTPAVPVGPAATLVSSAALAAGTIIPLSTGVVLGAVVDRAGRLWVLSSGTSDVIDVVDPSGSVTTLPAGPGAVAIAIDAIGRPRVLSNGATGANGTIVTIDPTTLAVLGTLTLPANGLIWLDFVFDSVGRCWLQDPSATITVLAPDGSFALSTSTSFGLPAILTGGIAMSGSDPTGVQFTGVTEHSGDHDGDGESTDSEARRGSDPLDATSVPPTLIAGGPPLSGTQLPLTLSSPTEPFHGFITAASLGTGGVPLSPFSPLTAPLDADALFFFWLSPYNSLMTPGIAGTLDLAGTASLSLILPQGSAGITLYLAALTFQIGGAATSATPPLPITIL